jgi:hypothetical protein
MLIELSRSVTDVAPVRIATEAEALTAPGTAATTIGRGATGTDGKGEGTFRSGRIEVQPPSACPEQLVTPLLRTWSLCTRDPRMGERGSEGPCVSACFGDSGGPLLAGSAAAPRLIGVVSWGPSWSSRAANSPTPSSSTANRSRKARGPGTACDRPTPANGSAAAPAAPPSAAPAGLPGWRQIASSAAPASAVEIPRS